MNESKMSIVVPRGQMKPQKKRPKMSVATSKNTARRAAEMIVRKTMLVMMRMSGSNRKKKF
jgi:hypothetical protein